MTETRDDEFGQPMPMGVDLPSSEGVPADGPLPSARVLMVEPDMGFGRLLRDYLVSRGWSVTWILKGRDAIRRWPELSPDLLLTEIQGADLDGFDLIDQIRRTAAPPPIVVCTRLAGARAWSAETLGELGVAALRVRPLRFPELAELLEQVIAHDQGRVSIPDSSLP